MDEVLTIIDGFDKDFLLYQMKSHSPTLDIIMHWISEKLTWFPLYALIIYQLFKQTKTPFVYLGCLLLAVGCSDYIASGLAKPFFERLRPCHNNEINQFLDLSHCRGKFGFFSSHSAISFCIAGFITLLSKKYSKLLILWATIVAYSRVYLCVHYPSDIIMGAFTGLTLSYMWHQVSLSLAPILKR